MLRRVRDAAAPRDAAHVHDVGLPLALDDVDAVEVDAEGPAAAPRDVAELRAGCERLPAAILLRSRRKHLLDAEQPLADHVDLPVPPLGRVVALREDRVSAGRHRGQFRDALDHPHADPIRAVIRLEDEWTLSEEWRQPLRVRRDVRGGSGHPGQLQDPAGDDLVAQRGGHWIGIHDGGSLGLQRSGDAQGETARFLQEVEIVFYPHAREVDGPLGRMDDVDDHAGIR